VARRLMTVAVRRSGPHQKVDLGREFVNVIDIARKDFESERVSKVRDLLQIESDSQAQDQSKSVPTDHLPR
jgi:hypothetical protein